MEDKLKVIPVMLPTRDKSPIWTDNEKKIYHCIDIEDSLLSTRYGSTPNHLYLVSDREIKEGDYFYHGENGHTIHKYRLNGEMEPLKYEGQKIEASTNPSLGLPLIPESFVREWVKKQGKIEYTYIKTRIDKIAFPDGAILTRRSDPNDIHSSEVIILPTKSSWNREELKGITRDAYHLGASRTDTFDEWFDANY